ncbi:MAG: hypothetical protein COV59_00465 [Candidatus Magasanikbacteria bacterium CG11_big_fil_rev_8_21_14_0_20_39_34]|uniref:Transcription regulator TrmB N-terminal domain-containing protein n=1 Tax=Candidatus Magasanikbacteria bacterium CG11_big_fil_rev_8_21_14_0_20_39_34 TaxID=1974653 RepID=A0A2H0N6R0_9BACT|nr:MAG: hypothetical protein COV59_00465 [Candidatus Magasanikbacteria bacterium CG11_big_fil_rev_8_21_14_0_20_39_34]
MNIYKLLEEFDITKSKAEVYLACLGLGSASTQAIALKVNLPRTTVHEILQGLCSMGIVSYITKGRTRIYIAEHPKKFQKILKNKEKLLEGGFPDLLSLYNPEGIRPQVRIYEGVEGIKTVFEDTLTVKSDTLHAILSMEDLYHTIGKSFMTSYTQRRIASGTHLHVIRSQEKEVQNDWPSSTKENREVHFAPDGMIFAMTMYLYNNKVAIMSTKKEGFGMIVESVDFYNTQKNLFDILWQVTRIQKKID